MHVSSLPSRYGIGDCGPAAFEFVDFLKQAKQSWWQVLPLGPMGLGNSPYQAYSAFAGSALWISPHVLRKDGWLKQDDLEDVPRFPDRVNYPAVSELKHRLLGIAFGRFLKQTPPKAFQLFEEEHRDWLEDYALFSALQQLQEKASWTRWPEVLRTRERHALKAVREQLRDNILFQKFIQFLLFQQWDALRTYAAQRGIGLIGDIPFFVSLDSADVWAHRELFELNAKGEPLAVAGVPPDAFAKTGQRWGNPLYDWAEHKAKKYAWWIRRFEWLFQLFDVVRLDHFIGFHRYWEIPAHDTTALNGRYQPGPGLDFFKAILKALPQSAFIAEDLGIVVPEVTALREQLNFPGMSVLQFAFSGDPDKNPYLPNKLKSDTVVYTGTHDNNTTVGWFTHNATDKEKKLFQEYADSKMTEPYKELIRMAYASNANTAIIPMQDVLGLGEEARMNFPGVVEDNWEWRLKRGLDLKPYAQELRQLSEKYAR